MIDQDEKTEKEVTTRIVNGFSIMRWHQYRDGEPMTEALVRDSNGVLLATGEWTNHLDAAEVAGVQVDKWLHNGAHPDSSIGCGWATIHGDEGDWI